MDIFDFVILALAAWRLSSLLANEEGPGGIFERLRYRLGVRYDETSFPYAETGLAKGALCVWCSSVWFGAGLALLRVLFGQAATVLFSPLALSAGAVLFDGTIGFLRNGESEHSDFTGP